MEDGESTEQVWVTPTVRQFLEQELADGWLSSQESGATNPVVVTGIPDGLHSSWYATRHGYAVDGGRSAPVYHTDDLGSVRTISDADGQGIQTS